MYLLNKTLLQVLQDRKTWERLHNAIHVSRFDKEVRTVLNAINRYWKTYQVDRLDPEVFAGKFFLDIPVDDSERAVYQKIFEIMQDPPDPDTAKEIIRSLRLMEFNMEVEQAQNSYVLGEDIDLYETVKDHLHTFERDVRRDVDLEYCQASVEEIIDEAQNGTRMPWRLKCMQNAMPDLRTTKQVIVAARPGVGKTSFLADNCNAFLESKYVQETRRPIVWFNNESEKRAICGNSLRASLGKSFDEIGRMGMAEAQRQWHENIGGPDMFRVYDIHRHTCSTLERIIERDNPCVVVWDMLDNVTGAPGVGNDARTDQMLERLYQWARECAVAYDFLSLPTSQVSVEGADLQWIPASALKDSKTGKQGACDAIVTIGFDPDPKFAKSRFIYIPKSKSTPLDGYLDTCQTEVVFDAPTSRYLNPKEV